MKKIYVVDTNVLILSPKAILCFEDNQVIIPLVVIEELDNLKNAEGEKGMSARSVIRLLESYRREGDPKQIDNPLLDERTNGLSYASEKMKGSSLCYQVTMTREECERSKLALEAISRM